MNINYCVKMYAVILVLLTITSFSTAMKKDKQECQKAKTVVSGSEAPKNYCAGDLVFEDNFDRFDINKWQNAITFWGGGSHEFQWYTDDAKNSFTKNGNLFLRPTLTSDYLGSADRLYWETIDLGSKCTNDADDGCKRTGTSERILKPIRSASINTAHSFAFKYGHVEIKARMPSGDWLWPAIRLVSHDHKYGPWPRSGAINVVEGRGNHHFIAWDKNMTSARVGSFLHWGPNSTHNSFLKTFFEQYNSSVAYDADFKTYELLWTPDNITFIVEGKPTGVVDPGTSFWDLGGYSKIGLTDNPWIGGEKMAPFDQEFYFIVNLAVGGIYGYFPDEGKNYPLPKPWKNTSPNPASDFWNGRVQWLPTWKLDENDSYDASLKVDYIRVWAV